jgi:small-conductance mechanosensitive channel
MFIFEPEVVEAEEVVEGVDESVASTFPQQVNESEKIEVMPVALRPETPVTVEAVTELAQSIMEKERALFENQQKLKREEKRINLLFEDVKRERDELEAFGDKIDAKLREAREALELLRMESKSVSDQARVLSDLEEEIGKTRIELVDDELDRRVKVVKNWFKDLDPEQAANYLKEFADRGDLEFAARLLDSLQDRQIAKVLAAFNDAPLVAQIVDSFTKGKPASDSRNGTKLR